MRLIEWNAASPGWVVWVRRMTRGQCAADGEISPNAHGRRGGLANVPACPERACGPRPPATRSTPTGSACGGSRRRWCAATRFRCTSRSVRSAAPAMAGVLLGMLALGGVAVCARSSSPGAGLATAGHRRRGRVRGDVRGRAPARPARPGGQPRPPRGSCSPRCATAGATERRPGHRRPGHGPDAALGAAPRTPTAACPVPMPCGLDGPVLSRRLGRVRRGDRR